MDLIIRLLPLISDNLSVIIETFFKKLDLDKDGYIAMKLYTARVYIVY